MTHDNELLNRVRVALASVPDVQEKRMFGSTAFMVDGKLCITARAERLMCRIDPELHEALVKRKGCQTVVMKGRQYRGYVYVDALTLRTNKALQYWLDLALNYNRTL